jgi:RNA polymerase sigma-70 factor (ECF subfamily)
VRGRQGPPDKRLFRRARQGDRQAFGVILRRYDPRLRRLAARLIAEPERVDTVLSRAYLRAWRSVPMVVPPNSVAEWLYRIVYNACINEMRWAPERSGPAPLPGPRVPLPLASAERRLVGLRALSPEERVPLVLVDGEGFTLEATARILGRSERETAADLTRARYRWRGLVVGEPTPLPETVVELPPDPEAAPPLAELAEVDTTGSELRGHVKLVGVTAATAPAATTADTVATAEPEEPKAKRSRSRSTSRRKAKPTSSDAGTATQQEGDDAAPADAAAVPSDDAREN